MRIGSFLGQLLFKHGYLFGWGTCSEQKYLQKRYFLEAVTFAQNKLFYFFWRATFSAWLHFQNLHFHNCYYFQHALFQRHYFTATLPLHSISYLSISLVIKCAQYQLRTVTVRECFLVCLYCSKFYHRFLIAHRVSSLII